jgi:hypothetical protein
MKKNGFLLVLLFMFGFAHSQITFEHSYDFSGDYTKLANSGYKIFLMDVVNSKCLIYNTNHTLWKTINLSVPANNYLYDIKYVSENLFTTDNSLALSYVYYSYDATNDYYTYTARIIKENGTELQIIPGCQYLYVVDLGELGTKMEAYVFDYSLLYYTVKTRYYTLPGTLVNGIENHPVKELSSLKAFPNPAGNIATIPYILPEGESEGTITITDLQGKTVQNYTVDRNFDNIIIETGQLPGGVYLYYLKSGNFTSRPEKLIVQ